MRSSGCPWISSPRPASNPRFGRTWSAKPSASRDQRIVLAEIEEAAAKILAFTHGLTRDEAFADAMRLDAVLHNLHVLGETVKSLPEDIRSRRADVPWREIAGMRDVIAHAYFALDFGIVWDAIERDLPDLLAAVRDLLQRA